MQASRNKHKGHADFFAKTHFYFSLAFFSSQCINIKPRLYYFILLFIVTKQLTDYYHVSALHFSIIPLFISGLCHMPSYVHTYLQANSVVSHVHLVGQLCFKS